MKYQQRYKPSIKPRLLHSPHHPAREERWFQALLSLPPSLLKPLLRGQHDTHAGHQLDIKAQLFINRTRTEEYASFDYSEKALEEPFWSQTLLDIDARWASRTIVSNTLSSVSDIEIPVKGGSIILRICIPDGIDTDNLPVILYSHGGAFIMGSVNSHEGVLRYLCQQTGAIVVGVNYRLAPAVKFPVPMEDAIAAYLWCRENIKDIGGNPDQIAVAGDSAGAMLSLNICHEMRERGMSMPFMQALFYPYTDIACSGSSAEAFADKFILTKSLFNSVPSLLLSDPEESDDVRLNIVGKMAMEGMPDTLIVTAGFDMLKDQGVQLSDKMRAAGVPVTYWNYPTLSHSFLEQFSARLPAAKCAFNEITAFMRNFFRSSDS